jgi:hypothetical protein
MIKFLLLSNDGFYGHAGFRQAISFLLITVLCAACGSNFSVTRKNSKKDLKIRALGVYPVEMRFADGSEQTGQLQWQKDWDVVSKVDETSHFLVIGPDEFLRTEASITGMDSNLVHQAKRMGFKKNHVAGLKVWVTENVANSALVSQMASNTVQGSEYSLTIGVSILDPRTGEELIIVGGHVEEDSSLETSDFDKRPAIKQAISEALEIGLAEAIDFLEIEALEYATDLNGIVSPKPSLDASRGLEPSVRSQWIALTQAEQNNILKQGYLYFGEQMDGERIKFFESQSPGVLLTEVPENMPLKVGDFVFEVNGKVIWGLHQLRRAIWLSRGNKSQFKVLRKGQIQEVSGKLPKK